MLDRKFAKLVLDTIDEVGEKRIDLKVAMVEQPLKVAVLVEVRVRFGAHELLGQEPEQEVRDILSASRRVVVRSSPAGDGSMAASIQQLEHVSKLLVLEAIIFGVQELLEYKLDVFLVQVVVKLKKVLAGLV